MFSTNNSFGKNFSSTDGNWLSSPFLQSSQQANSTPSLFGVRTNEPQQANNRTAVFGVKNGSQQENKDKHNSSNRELIEKIINERQTDRLLMEKIANDLTSLHQKIDVLMSRNNPQSLSSNNYVVCPLHQHVLKETDLISAGSMYTNGFTCDICYKMFNNKDEKFYQCTVCNSNVQQGKFDICTSCILNQLKR